MPSDNTAREESGDRIPHWAATVGRQTFGTAPRRDGRPAVRFGDRAEQRRGHTVVARAAARLARLPRREPRSSALRVRGIGARRFQQRRRALRLPRPAGPGQSGRPKAALAHPAADRTGRSLHGTDDLRVEGEGRLSTPEIRRRLTASRYPAPLDPETGEPGVWTVAMVRAILRDPKYLGRQVWGRTHHGKPTPRTAWIWSEAWAHPPPVTAEEFASADRRSWHVPSSVKTKDDPANALPSDHRQAA
ncbi:recombinase family protein [Amycolatopsis sp. lyj-23]|uniref:recombinase family protein n=1 Tax=Amycolatopsis sp. lyj-23 TaxID=2789283 RepID=UPI00397CACA0